MSRTSLVHISYDRNVTFAKFRECASGSECAAVFHHHVVGIFRLSSREDVFRVNTKRTVASVQDVKAWGYRTMMQNKGNAVSVILRPLTTRPCGTKNTVALMWQSSTGLGTSPDPAWRIGFLINEPEEAGMDAFKAVGVNVFHKNVKTRIAIFVNAL